MCIHFYLDNARLLPRLCTLTYYYYYHVVTSVIIFHPSTRYCCYNFKITGISFLMYINNFVHEIPCHAVGKSPEYAISC